MSKVRTTDQPAPEHTQATEFRNKIEANAKVAQIHSEALRRTYESALPDTEQSVEDEAPTAGNAAGKD